MPFFHRSQRLSRNFRALAIFLKGFDFLSFISQRYVYRNGRSLELEEVLRVNLSSLSAIRIGETEAQRGKDQPAGLECGTPVTGSGLQLSALPDCRLSGAFAFHILKKASKGRRHIDIGTCLLISPSGVCPRMLDREGRASSEGTGFRLGLPSWGASAQAGRGPSLALESGWQLTCWL